MQYVDAIFWKKKVQCDRHPCLLYTYTSKKLLI